MTAISPAMMKAAGRVKRPISTRMPPTTSITPAIHGSEPKAGDIFTAQHLPPREQRLVK